MPATSRRWRRSRLNRRCSSTPRARPGGRRAWCCRIRAIYGFWTCAPRPAPPPGQRVLVAAPLYHMNASVDVPGDAEQRRHDRAAAVVHCAGYIDAASRYQVPVAHRGADDDCDDAARARRDGGGGPFVGAEPAPRFGAAVGATDRADAPGVSQCAHCARLRHDRGGTGGVCPAPRRAGTAAAVARRGASGGRAASGARWRGGDGRGRVGNALSRR